MFDARVLTMVFSSCTPSKTRTKPSRCHIQCIASNNSSGGFVKLRSQAASSAASCATNQIEGFTSTMHLCNNSGFAKPCSCYCFGCLSMLQRIVRHSQTDIVVVLLWFIVRGQTDVVHSLRPLFTQEIVHLHIASVPATSKHFCFVSEGIYFWRAF